MRAEHDTATYELTLSFDELTLIYKSLLAAKSLGVLSQSDEFVDDTIQLVDQVLSGQAGV
jgi:hypothetical protein